MRLDINDKERATLLRAVEMINDMSNDMLFEDIPLNLFPREGHAENTTVTPENAKAIRKSLHEEMEQMISIRSLLTKLGGKVNDKGYSV